MQINAIRKVMGLAAVLAVVAGTTAVNAQSKPQDEGGFDQPLRSTKRSGVQSTMVMTEKDDEHTYTVRVEGDKVTAEVDGKAVPKDRVRNRNGRIEILDENKEVIKTFNMQMGMTAQGGPAQRRFQVETIEPGQGRGMGGGGNWIATEEPPKAMMGVTMTDAEDEEGASIASVMEGMPADKAGLKVGDIVVEANGKKIAGQQELREIIRGANPDDTLTLKVDRDGKNVDVKVKLEKWDQSKMMTFAPAMPLQGFAFGGGSESMDAARESIENAIAILKDNDKLDGKSRERVQRALENALKSLDKASKQSNMMIDRDVEGQMRVFGPQGRAFTVPTPAPAPAVNADLARQLEKLHAQMERMNKRMEELEKNK